MVACVLEPTLSAQMEVGTAISRDAAESGVSPRLVDPQSLLLAADEVLQ
jgi:hypothetical protein